MFKDKGLELMCSGVEGFRASGPARAERDRERGRERETQTETDRRDRQKERERERERNGEHESVRASERGREGRRDRERGPWLLHAVHVSPQIQLESLSSYVGWLCSRLCRSRHCLSLGSGILKDVVSSGHQLRVRPWRCLKSKYPLFESSFWEILRLCLA